MRVSNCRVWVELVTYIKLSIASTILVKYFVNYQILKNLLKNPQNQVIKNIFSKNFQDNFLRKNLSNEIFQK